MVALSGGKVIDVKLDEALALPRRVQLDEDGVVTARNMGVSFGDG